MGNRVLAHYEEPRYLTGPRWTLEFERSADGPPTVFVTIKHEAFGGEFSDELTIVVSDFPTVVAPVLEWANRKVR